MADTTQVAGKRKRASMFNPMGTPDSLFFSSVPSPFFFSSISHSSSNEALQQSYFYIYTGHWILCSTLYL